MVGNQSKIIAGVLGLAIAGASVPFDLVHGQSLSLVEDELGSPFRVRDYTFPSFLVLGFTPAPAAPLGMGGSAYEFHVSLINDFQTSQRVEDYLGQTRTNTRRRLDAADVAFILGLPEGDSYYIDGEFTIVEFGAHWGLTDRIDVGAVFNYIYYGSDLLDGLIHNFHELIGLDQPGRSSVEAGQVQVVLGRNGEDLVLLDRPSVGGLMDPSLYMRIALPRLATDWRTNLALGVKLPLMDTNKLLSTGSADYGFQFTADRRFARDALIVNLGAVFPGGYEQTHFDPPDLPYLHISWLHRAERWANIRLFAQALFAEHPYRDIVDSELSDLAFQLTVGLKWDTAIGVIGVGLTENVLNFRNTPDLGVHFTWGIVNGGVL